MTETITWHDVRARRPDDKTTVLLALSSGGDPVWLGYTVGGQWFAADGTWLDPNTVTHWADVPAGPEHPGVVPTVADVHRRTAELLWTPAGDGLADLGEIRHRLISEFGRDLFNAAAEDALCPATGQTTGSTDSTRSAAASSSR